MADEIIQQLGFDASAALDALAKMDMAFGSFEARLSSVAESMAVWNAMARETRCRCSRTSPPTPISAAAAMAQVAYGLRRAAGERFPASPVVARPVRRLPAGHAGPGAEGHAADRQDADRRRRQGGGQVHRVVGDHEPRRDDAGHRPRVERHPRRHARGVRLQLAVYDPDGRDSVDRPGRRHQPGFDRAARRRLVPRVQHPPGAGRRGAVSGALESVHHHRAADRSADGGLQAVARWRSWTPARP